MDRKRLLLTPFEQTRLLDEVPEVTLDITDPEPALYNSPDKNEKDDNSSLKSAIKASRKAPVNNFTGCGTSSFQAIRTKATEEKKSQTAAFIEQCWEPPSFGNCIHPPEATKVNDSFDRDNHSMEVKECVPEASLGDKMPNSHFSHLDTVHQRNINQIDSNYSGGKQQRSVLVKQVAVKNQSYSAVIELSDDEEEQDAEVKIDNDTLEDPIWYCISPHGVKTGLYSMSLLKQWRDSSSKDLKFKIWRKDQSEEEAIFLSKAIRQAFPE